MVPNGHISPGTREDLFRSVFKFIHINWLLAHSHHPLSDVICVVVCRMIYWKMQDIKLYKVLCGFKNAIGATKPAATTTSL